MALRASRVESEGPKDFLINDPISRQLYLGERFVADLGRCTLGEPIAARTSKILIVIFPSPQRA